MVPGGFVRRAALRPKTLGKIKGFVWGYFFDFVFALCSGVLPWVLAEHFWHFLAVQSRDSRKPVTSAVLGQENMPKMHLAALACKRVSRGQGGFYELSFNAL